MSKPETGQQYDAWLRSRRLSALTYALLASVPGAMLVNTPAFRLHEKLELRSDQRLLDIGCGRASLLQILASHVRLESPPVGVDASREMLLRAGADLSASQARRPVELTLATATSLPFADGGFDVVTCSYVVKHLADAALPAFFNELLRVLKPGGFALLWEFAPTRSAALNRWHRWLLSRGGFTANLRSRTALMAMAIQAGFGWVEDAGLRPFLWPPMPRVSLIAGKAESWRARTGRGRADQAARGASV